MKNDNTVPIRAVAQALADSRPMGSEPGRVTWLETVWAIADEMSLIHHDDFNRKKFFGMARVFSDGWQYSSEAAIEELLRNTSHFTAADAAGVAERNSRDAG